MELASALLNAAAAGAALWIARRLGGDKLQLAIAGVLAVAIRGYGLSVLTHPWNPYFPLMLWIVVLLATWAVLSGNHRLAVVVVVIGSIAAQTHVPYLLPAVAMSALALGALAARRDLRPLLASVGAAAFFWLPAGIDQVRREPGNISMLIDHFTGDTDEATIGVVRGTGVFLRHLDLPRAALEMLRSSDAFLDVSGETGGVPIGGLIVFVAWGAAVVVAVRRRHLPLLRLDAVLAVALFVGWFSMTRIFGKIWFYLTLWAWGTALLVLVSIVWAAFLVVRDRFDDRTIGSWNRPLIAAAIAVPALLSLMAAVTLQVPEENLSTGLGDVLDDTERAVRDGVGDATGPDGRYVVFWQDVNFIGAQGYGLVNELERRGLDVGVHETWRVPVTPHRVFPQGTYDAEVHIVSGVFIDEWRSRDGYVEVTSADPRTPAEAAEFDRLRSSVLARFDELDRPDLVETLDVNLFGASLDPDLPDDVVDDLGEMLVLTAPVAVFIAPAGSTF